MNYDSYWEMTGPTLTCPPLTADTTADVCVVGAGIAGMMTAYHLCREGKSVIVIDKAGVGSGQTQNTTAHLTNAIDDRYVSIEAWHGSDGAKLAAQSHTAAIDRIELIAMEEGIDCEFTRLDGYLFDSPKDSPNLLNDELRAAHSAGVVVEPVLHAPLHHYFTGPALKFPRQAQVHPLKLMIGLAAAVLRRGGRIFTQAHAEGIESVVAESKERTAEVADDQPLLRVKIRGELSITAKAVVVATNSPFNDMFAIHTKQAPYLTYVCGFAVPRGSVDKALYWDATNPYHFVRLEDFEPMNVNGAVLGNPETEQLLLVGGEDHKTGQANDAEARFSRLATWTKIRFPILGEPRFRWSGQVMETNDGLAFIGRNPADNPNIYVATGDSGQGMTHGTIAGMLLSDLIVGRPNPWASLYSPSRLTIMAAGRFLEENLNVAQQFAAWITPGDVSSVDLIPKGQGAIVRDGLSKLAVYRDPHGVLHACSAVCPHLGCLVNWNSNDATWDCPCHGSRFDSSGHVICGPAHRDLALIKSLVEPVVT